MPARDYLRSALFVDFDNIYLGLERQQPEAAELFGSKPDKWVQWLEEKANIKYGRERLQRKILVRRCYINPRSFHEYRLHYIRSGFEVVDCPPLTSQGKTSADMHMVIDMLDALDHSTQFDEFIVLSGDADFTPVLLRLRKHDRRTTILAVGPASPAYRSSSDFLLDENEFLEQGLGLEDKPAGQPAPRAAKGPISRSTREVLQKMATKLEDLAHMTGRIEAVQLPGIFKDFPEFRSGENWLEFFSLRKMTEAIMDISDSLEIVDDDPWWVSFEKGLENGQASAADLPSEEEIVDVVIDVVDSSETPVVLAAVAQKISQAFDDKVRRSNWLGRRSFKGLLEELDLGPLRVSNVIPGFVYDPDRHEPPAPPSFEDDMRQEVPPIANKISKFTEMPCLSTAHYAAVLREIAREVNEHGYHLTKTSKAVRDRCAGKSIPIARSHVSFILKGIAFAGHRFVPGEEDPSKLGEALAENTISLCHRVQIDLTEEEIDDMHEWILGDLEEAWEDSRPSLSAEEQEALF